MLYEVITIRKNARIGNRAISNPKLRAIYIIIGAKQQFSIVKRCQITHIIARKGGCSIGNLFDLPRSGWGTIANPEFIASIV